MNKQLCETKGVCTNNEGPTEKYKVIDVYDLEVKQSFIETVHNLRENYISEEDYNNYEKAKQEWDNEKTINNICNLAQAIQKIFEKLK